MVSFTPKQILYDRQRILELVSIVGGIRDHVEIYRLLVKAKQLEPNLQFRYDLCEFVRFSVTQGLIHDDVEALISLGYLEDTGKAIKITDLGKEYLNNRSPSKDREIFQRVKSLD